MASRYANQRRYEEPETGSNAALFILAAVAMFGLTILFIYICLAPPQAGTGMGAIRDALVGLGGSLAPVLPLILAWGGWMCVSAARGKRVSPWVAMADALLFVCLFTAVHIFFAERIRVERMTISSFANFVSKSYSYGKGGGAIGALLAWPLYRNLGVAGGFIATLLLMILLLTATGRIPRLVSLLSSHSPANVAAPLKTH